MLQIPPLNRLGPIASLLLILLLSISNSASLQFNFHPTTSSSTTTRSSRRAFFVKAAATLTAATTTVTAAEAAIDVSGLRVVAPEGQPALAPGRAPNQPPSGPLAGTSLGFQVGGGPRPESEVRKIDEARYQAAGKGPSFLVGVPREDVDKLKTTDMTRMR
jgi:hypothetical protein